MSIIHVPPRRTLLYGVQPPAGAGAAGLVLKPATGAPFTQDIILDFKPQAMLFFTTGQNTLTTIQAEYVGCTGFACRGADETIYNSAEAFMALDNKTGSATRSGMRLWNDKCIGTVDETGAVTTAAHVQSFNDNGVTLNWTANDGATAYIGYLAFMSPGILDASILGYTSRGSVGSKNITGFGFDPSFFFNIGGGILGATSGSRTTIYNGFGYCGQSPSKEQSHSNNATNADLFGGVGSHTNHRTRYHSMANAAAVPGMRTRIYESAWITDGFTLYEDLSPGYAYGHNALGFLVGDGFEYDMGSFQAPAVDGNQVISGLSFSPDLVLLFAIHGVFDTYWNGTSDWNFGGFDKDGNQFAFGASYDNENPSDAGRAVSGSHCLYIVTEGTSGLEATFAFVSMNGDGFTMYRDYLGGNPLVFWLAMKF
jgi:hypothetical protein